MSGFLKRLLLQGGEQAKIRQVYNSHKDEVLKLPGVRGIHCIKDGIQILVDSGTDRSTLPKELDGIKVSVVQGTVTLLAGASPSR